MNTVIEIAKESEDDVHTVLSANQQKQRAPEPINSFRESFCGKVS